MDGKQNKGMGAIVTGKSWTHEIIRQITGQYIGQKTTQNLAVHKTGQNAR